MKKIFAIMIVSLLGLQLNAQEEIDFGAVRTDGYNHITKGAFWSTRPEAKMVYEGSTPPGVTVYILETEYFVRFADNEHNSMDRNYIVFPKGAKVYSKNGNYYSANCGNRIVFMRPVNKVKVVEKPVYAYTHRVDTLYLQPTVITTTATATITNSGNSTTTPSEEVGETRYQPVPVYQQPVDTRRSWYGGGNQQQSWRQTSWNVGITYQPPVRVQHQWPQQPIRQNPIRFPNDGDGHLWNPNAGGLIRIPNDASGHAFGSPPANQWGNQTGGIRLPNN